VCVLKGALTHGDRRATETRDLSRFNIDNKYGRTALEATMRGIVGIERPPLVPPPEDYKGDFFAGEHPGTFSRRGILLAYVVDDTFVAFFFAKQMLLERY
jgi:hypothetical protein